MSEASPFTLVKTPESETSAPKKSKARIALPTKRQPPPQAQEPAPLPMTAKKDPHLKDVVERVKKAAKAEPLARIPRPAQDARKDLGKGSSGVPLAAEVESKTKFQPGCTKLPPPRKVAAVESVQEEIVDDTPLLDPFETNDLVAAEMGLGNMIAAMSKPPATLPTRRNAPVAKQGAALIAQENQAGDASETAPAPLTPAAIRRSEIKVAPLPQVELPLTPRGKPQQQEFKDLAPTRPLPAPAKKKQKHVEQALPEPKAGTNFTKSSEVEGWLKSAGVEIKNRTPRSASPIAESQLKSDEPALVSSKSIKFCCPACNHTITIPKKIAGSKSRCPQCSSAIRTPHPKFGRGTYNYERDVESLLHPEHFPLPPIARPKLMGIPIPEAHSAIMGSAAAMLVGSAIFAMRFHQDSPAVIQAQQRAVEAENPPSLAEPDLRKEDPFALQKSAEEIVSKYLATAGWEGKSKFVRETERVAPLMKDYFSSGNAAAPITPKKVSASAPSYYQGEQLKQRRSTVVAEWADGNVARFVVEYLPEGPKIEWESSVAYSPNKWKDIVNAPADPKAPGKLIRVSAKLAKYWNRPFDSDKDYVSVALEDPVTGDSLGNGYIPRRSEDGVRLRTYLYGGNKPDPVMLEIRPVENSSKDRVVEITRFIKGGFRQPEPEGEILSVSNK